MVAVRSRFDLEVSDLQPEPRAGDGARCWFQIMQHDNDLARNDVWPHVSLSGVTGLLLVVIELKKPGMPVRAALEQLNAALPPDAIPTSSDELTHDLLLPRLLSGQVALRSQTGLC